MLEETGCEAGELVPLGQLYVDCGRLETQQWAFFAPAARVVNDRPTGEEELEVLFVTPDEFKEAILRREFSLAVHLGIVGLDVLSDRLVL